MGIVVVVVVVILIVLYVIGKKAPEPESTGCSACKYWDNSSNQGKCNLTGDLYMRDGCSHRPR